MSNTPQERTVHPSDLPQPDGLAVPPDGLASQPDGLAAQPATHLAEDLEELVASAHRAERAWSRDQPSRHRRESVLDLPEPDTEELISELEEDECCFVLLDKQGEPVPGVSATPQPDGDRNRRSSPGEAALRDWRLKHGSRKAAAIGAERERELVSTLRGAAGLMAILLCCTVVGVRLWRSAGPVEPSPESASLALASGTGALSSAVAELPGAVAALSTPRLPAPSPAALTAPSIPALPAPEPEPEPAPVQPPEPPSTSTATGTSLPSQPGTSGEVVAGTLKHWTGQDGYLYWQWDYLGAEPLDLQWRDPSGDLRMQDRVCDGRVDALTGRCYVGRSMARFQTELGRGAPTGMWTLESCVGGQCSIVSRFQLPR